MKNRLPLASPPNGSVNQNGAAHARGKLISIASHPQWLHSSDPATVPDLMRALHGALSQMQGSPVFYMSKEEATVGHMMESVHRQLRETDAPLRLNRLLQQAQSERAVLCLRLALLELVRLGVLQLRSERHCSEILLERKAARAV